MGPCIVEIDRIVIREVQYQFEVNRCRNEEVNVKYCETIIIRQTLIFVYFVSRPIDEFKFLTNNYVKCSNKIKTELPLT